MASKTITVSENLTDFGTKLLLFQQSKKFCDATLIVNGETIEVHANVLAASSKYFEQKISESAEQKIIFKNIDQKKLQILIEYCYTGKIESTENEIEGLIKMAQDLYIDTFVDNCIKSLEANLSIDNCLLTWKVAQSKKMENLRLVSLEFIKKNFIEVSKSQSFLELDYKDISEFVNLDLVASEMHIFEALKNWENYDTTSRSKNLADLLDQIKLENLPIKVFTPEPSQLCNLSSACLQKFNEFMKTRVSNVNNMKESSEVMNFDGSTLMVIGGSEGPVAKIIEIYDKNNKEWIEINEFKIKEDCFTTVLLDDKLLLIGGFINKKTVQSYDLKTGHMETLPCLKYGRCSASSVKIGKDVYVIGGFDGKDSMSSVEKWDSKSKSWSVVASLATARYGHGSVVLNDHIYVVGGYETKYLSSVESYDSATDKWINCKSMNEERGYCGVASFQGYLYAVGGSAGKLLRSVERYDPKADLWTTIESLNIIKFLMGTTIFMGQLVTAGGFEKVEIVCIPVEEKHDTNKHKWKPMASLKNPRKYFDFIEISWDLAEHVMSRRPKK